MDQLLQAVVLGVLIGGVYALMATGLALVFGVMEIVNVAHGATLVGVAFLTWWLWRLTGVDPLLLGVLLVPVMFAVGWLAYKGVIARIGVGSVAMSVLLTFGIALTIEGVLDVTAGNHFRSITPSYFDQAYHVVGVDLPKPQVYGALLAVVTLTALYFVLTKTWTGRAIRATSQNPSGAALIGISAVGISALTFALGTATTGVGGAILGVLYPFFPASHYVWISRLLGIIVLGGMGSLPGALVGSLLLGLAETMTATYVSLQWSTVVFYVAILVVLLVKPEGLFGMKLREDAVA